MSNGSTVISAPRADEGSGLHEPSRRLTFLTVKRINPRFRRTYGHWWIEVDGVESYGWWPSRCPIGLWGLFVELRGTLNGIGVIEGGTPTTDPYHLGDCDHAFHPLLEVAKSDDDVRDQIRAFSIAYSDVWRWRVRAGGSQASPRSPYVQAAVAPVAIASATEGGSERVSRTPALRGNSHRSDRVLADKMVSRRTALSSPKRFARSGRTLVGTAWTSIRL